MAPPVAPAGTTLIVLVLVFAIIAIISVFLRVWATMLRKRPFSAHDWLIFAGLIFTLGLGADQIAAVYVGGAGYYLAALELQAGFLSALVALAKTVLAAEYLWGVATWCIKMSILVMYTEVFDTRTFRRLTYGMMAFVTAFILALIITQSALCRPYVKNWEPDHPGHCGNSVDVQKFTAATNLVVDIMIAALPVPLVWSLQMSKSRRFLVVGLLSLGLIICAINIARLVVTYTSDWADASHSIIPVAIFAALEVDFGVIIACVPFLTPLFVRNHPSRYSEGTGPRLTDMEAAYKRDKQSGAGTFHRIVDESDLGDGDGDYALRNLGGSNTTTTRIGQGSEVSGDEALMRRSEENDIQVQTQYQVFKTSNVSSPTGHGQGMKQSF